LANAAEFPNQLDFLGEEADEFQLQIFYHIGGLDVKLAQLDGGWTGWIAIPNRQVTEM
jgi:hypothetical protein